MKRTSKYLSVFVLIITLAVPFEAYADCSNPAGVEGEQIFNDTYKVMQFCNGTEWHSMDASAIEGGLDNLGDHTATQNIDVSNNKITNLSNPTNNNDAANKSYVDTIVDTINTALTALTSTVSNKVNKAGDTMIGALTLSGAPSANNHAVTKSYVDTGLTGKVNTSGDTMAGSLILAGPPVSNNDAATKSYVDTVLASGGSGGSSSGTAGTCYYSNGTCGQGFAQMPGTYRPGSTNHNICCSSGFFAQDIVPNSYDIADAEMAGNEEYVSSIFQISGITTATIDISGEGSPEYRLCNNSNCSDILSSWKSTSQTVYESQYYQVRNTAPSTNGTHTATLSIGDGADNWILTVPATPDTIAFADVSEPPATTALSAIQRATGIYSADVSIDQGEFRICSVSNCATEVEPWGSTDKVILNNQYIQLRDTAPASGAETKTLTIGGTDIPWNINTLSVPTGLSVNHTNRSNQLQITMTGGTNVGTCDVMVGSYDIGDIDCDQNWTNRTFALNSGLYQTGNWNGWDVKLVAKTNSYDSGSIGTVTCTANGAQAAPDSEDNDCNGEWDDPVKTSVLTMPISSTSISSGGCNGEQVTYNSVYKYCTDFQSRQTGGFTTLGSYTSTSACTWTGSSWATTTWNYSSTIECYNISGYK